MILTRPEYREDTRIVLRSETEKVAERRPFVLKVQTRSVCMIGSILSVFNTYCSGAYRYFNNVYLLFKRFNSCKSQIISKFHDTLPHTILVIV